MNWVLGTILARVMLAPDTCISYINWYANESDELCHNVRLNASQRLQSIVSTASRYSRCDPGVEIDRPICHV